MCGCEVWILGGVLGVRGWEFEGMGFCLEIGGKAWVMGLWRLGGKERRG